MHAYPNKGQRRILPQEVRKWAKRDHNVELVGGFAEIVKPAVECTGRVASCMDINPLAWYLQLSSKNLLVWRTKPVPADIENRDIVFVFVMGLGNGSVFPQPSGQFDLYCNDKLITSFRVVKHSQYWQGKEGAFYFSANRIESSPPNSSICLDNFLMDESFASFGIGFLRVPADRVSLGKQAVLKVVPVSKVESTRWFQLVSASHCIEQADVFSGLISLCSNKKPEASGYNIYFGDIHTHSGEGVPPFCGMGTRKENYCYAKGPGGLDIYALSDHDWQISEDEMADYFHLADDFNEDGQFVALPAYEHTSTLYGHRNVYFRTSKGTVIPAFKDWRFHFLDSDEIAVVPTELWAGLEACGVDAITIPHHPSVGTHPLTWDFYNPHFDRLVETYSVWGSSEYYGDYPRGGADRFRGLFVRDALNKGCRLGIIASADGHDGHPGNAQSLGTKHRFMFHPLGSGWIAVLAPRLTRDDIFNAMYARRCYGTTGVPIVLDFTVNGQPMGSEMSSLRQGQAVILHITCHGSNGIDHVRIIKNGIVVKTIYCHGEWNCDIEWEDPAFDFAQPNYYYMRIVQVDGESAWSSPVWVG